MMVEEPRRIEENRASAKTCRSCHSTRPINTERIRILCALADLLFLINFPGETRCVFVRVCARVYVYYVSSYFIIRITPCGLRAMSRIIGDVHCDL